MSQVVGNGMSFIYMSNMEGVLVLLFDVFSATAGPSKVPLYTCYAQDGVLAPIRPMRT